MKKTVFSIVFLICVLLSGSSKALAASASVELTGKSVVTLGDEFEVDLTIDSEEAVSGLETYISYSDDIGEFISADSGIAGGKGLLRINIQDIEAEDETSHYSIKFLAKKAGTFSVSFSDEIHLFTYDNNSEISVSSTNLEMKVKNKRESSSDSSLANLKVAGKKLSPAFSKGNLDYSVTVDAEVESLIIGADPTDANSKVSVSGNKDLKEGNNEVEVVVTAEDGNSTTYKIRVIKEGKNDREEEKTTPVEKEKKETKASEIGEEKPASTKPEYVPDLPKTNEITETNSKDSKDAVVYVIIGAIVVLGIMLVVATIYLKRSTKKEEE